MFIRTPEPVFPTEESLAATSPDGQAVESSINAPTAVTPLHQAAVSRREERQSFFDQIPQGFEMNKSLLEDKPLSAGFWDVTKAAALNQSHTAAVARWWGAKESIWDAAFKGESIDEGFDPTRHIPDEYLDDYEYFADTMSVAQVEDRARQLGYEKWSKGIADEYPWGYGGAALAIGFTNPTSWMFPATRAYQLSKSVYTAGLTSLGARGWGQAVASLGLAGAASGLADEVALHQIQQLRTLEESAFSVLSSAVLSAAFGTLPIAYRVGKNKRGANVAQAEINKIMAGNTLDPAFQPPPNIYAQQLGPFGISDLPLGNAVVGIPNALKKVNRISAQNRLLFSPSDTAVGLATDAYPHPWIINKNLGQNLNTQNAWLNQINGIKQSVTSVMSGEVMNLFRAQQGIGPDGMFRGVRSRVAEYKKQGLNIKEFSEAVYQVLETNQPGKIDQVNQAADVIRKKIIQPLKEAVVAVGEMDEKFLDPEFDAYFTRSWLRNEIGRNPDAFSKLLYDYFTYCNDYLIKNKEPIEQANAAWKLALKDFDRANKSLELHLGGGEYRGFQEQKKTKLEELKNVRANILLAVEPYRIKNKELRAANKDIRQQIKALEKEGKSSAALKKQLKANEKEIDLNIRKRDAIKEGMGMPETKAKRKEVFEGKEKNAERLKEELEAAKTAREEAREALYKVLPPEFRTPDGEVPSIKNPLELAAAVQETKLNILGMNEEQVMGPIIKGQGGTNPLLSRSLKIPHDFQTSYNGRTYQANDFFSKDIFAFANNYARRLAPVAVVGNVIKNIPEVNGLKIKTMPELKQRYLQGINDDYAQLMMGKTDAEANDLRNLQASDLRDVNRTFDLLFDVRQDTSYFGKGPAKFTRRLQQYTQQRLLGSAMWSNLTEIFVAPFQEGPWSFVQEYMAPLAKRSIALKMNKQQLKDSGHAIRTQLGMMQKAFIDNDDLLIKKGWWGNIAEISINMFGNVTGINQIGDLAENIAGNIAISATLRKIVKKIETGKISERDRIRLRQVGISEQSEKYIYDLWKKYGGKDSGAYYSNHGHWRSTNLQEAQAISEFAGSLNKSIVNASLRATEGDLPTMLDDPVIRMFTQFKSYLLAANNKILMSSFQKLSQREYSVLVSLAAMMAMGDIGYVMASLSKDPTGESLDLSPSKLFQEGFDRAGIMGIFMEPINIFRKVASEAGLFGIEPLSRYKSRGVVSSFIGPGLGTIEDVINVGIDITKALAGNKDYTTKDAEKILRLLPFQNLFYLRYLNQLAVHKVAASLGAEEA